ncbi:MAG: endonuclease Q family protein [Candidatus Bathyarchaeia archaeon]
MTLPNIARFARIKGLDVVGTGDFTHPRWLAELRRELVEFEDSHLYVMRGSEGVKFILSSEVNTVFEFQGSSRKVHHVIIAPDFDVVDQINDAISRFGDLAADGRPSLDVSPAHLVEVLHSISEDVVIFPSHAWTPWYGVFGSVSGFDALEDCYGDKSDEIFAIETGLSSDPPMNWRLSKLDGFSLVSNSDAHSPWPWRLGREANIFLLERLSYEGIIGAMKAKDPSRFKSTIETDPAYGKYHWSGHRDCGVAMPGDKAIALGNICPKCGRPLTKGVEQRVEELADRPKGFVPKDAIPFVRILPLSEIIAEVLGSSSPSSAGVWRVYNSLVGHFGDELEVLMRADAREIAKFSSREVAEAILKVRNGIVEIEPGFDGVYGRIRIPRESAERGRGGARLEDFL